MGKRPKDETRVAAASAGDTALIDGAEGVRSILLDSLLSGQFFNARSEGVQGSSLVDDSNAIDAAILKARNTGRTLIFTDGTYYHSRMIKWAYVRLRVMALGENVKFVHTGTGIAHSFSGMVTYPGTDGCIDGIFGGPGRFRLYGNPAGGTTRVVDIDNWHFGYMKIEVRDGVTGIYANDTGPGITGASSVCCTFDFLIRVAGIPFAVPMTYGLDMTKHYDCVFPMLIVEGVGAGGYAIWFKNSAGYKVQNGTVESNLGVGIFENNQCSNGEWNNYHCEANGGADWIVQGVVTRLIGCNGSNSTWGGAGAIVESGIWTNLENFDDTMRAEGVTFDGTFINHGTFTRVVASRGTAGAHNTVSVGWTAYGPPVITSEVVGGTPATYVVNDATYFQNVRQCTVRVDFGIGNQGVGNSGSILVPLPFPAAARRSIGSCYAYAAGGKYGRAHVGPGATFMDLRDFNAVTYIATGQGIIAEVTYEIG